MAEAGRRVSPERLFAVLIPRGLAHARHSSLASAYIVFMRPRRAVVHTRVYNNAESLRFLARNASSQPEEGKVEVGEKALSP